GSKGADLPMLGMKQMTNVSDLLGRDHDSPLRVERVEPAARAPAALADHPAGIPPAGRNGFWIRSLQLLRRPRRRHPGTGQRPEGTLIRHARLPEPIAISPLAVPMIEAPFETLLVAAIGRAALLATGLLAASHTAIALPAITMRAQIENCEAGGQPTNPLPENSSAGSRHRSPGAELDNRHPSWQDDSRVALEVLDTGPPIKSPGCSNN